MVLVSFGEYEDWLNAHRTSGTDTPELDLIQKAIRTSFRSPKKSWMNGNGRSTFHLNRRHSNTSTTFGRLMGGGNIAWFQIDFGENLFAFLARVEYKLRMAPGSEGGNLDFFVRVGVTNVFNEATPVAGVTAFQPGVSENVRSLTAVLSNRYGWIGIRDNGGGQGQLSIVDVKAWEIAI